MIKSKSPDYEVMLFTKYKDYQVVYLGKASRWINFSALPYPTSVDIIKHIEHTYQQTINDPC